MPLGYVKGNTHCQNWDYDRYAALPVFKALCDLARENSLSLHFSFSNITRAYDCEVRRIHYFKEGQNPYWVGCANRGGDTPLEALCDALRVALPVTPLLQVLCLEAECALFVMAVAKARETEAKIDKALDQLRGLLDTIMLHVLIDDYECENCIGMVEHGCYCKAMGASAPGNPLVYKEGDSAEDEEWRLTMRRDPGYDTDDDL